MVTKADQIFEAQSKSLLELLSRNGLGLYLPPYQRKYSWSRDQVEKLLDDTLHGLRNLADTPDTFTFLGSVITIEDLEKAAVEPSVKPELPAKVLIVIDGQQRLTSLLLLLVSSHNLIRQLSWKVFRDKEPDSETDSARHHLYAETLAVLQKLAIAYCEKQALGDAPVYPRLIRAYYDQWSKYKKTKKYESPIAHLVYEYVETANSKDASGRPAPFALKARKGHEDHLQGEDDLHARFSEMRTVLTKLSKVKATEPLEPLPPLDVLGKKGDLQIALFDHELNPELCTWMTQLSDEPEAELLRLVMFGSYVLNRVALTVVQGKSEDYAFTVFESLNTTGEPLTAFETFVPRVVKAEGIPDYKTSDAHEKVKAVEQYLGRFRAGDNVQKATRDLLVTFALAETGHKVSTRLSEQRNYMRETFERVDTDDYRAAYLSHLRDTATFIGSTWDPSGAPPQLVGLDTSALTDTVKLCLSFLTKLNHTIAIAPLVRFYSKALADEAAASNGEETVEARAKRIREFESAVKAVTAFTVFWRATRSTTGNIDGQYRDVMKGASITKIGPLARNWHKVPDPKAPEPVVDVEAFKAELVARLSSTEKGYGGIGNLATFIAEAKDRPLYSISQPLTRFILLAAYHDTTADPGKAGLVIQGKTGTAPCFTADGWLNEGHLTVEHVAPRNNSTDWDARFYESKDAVNRLGNLVLCPSAANSSLSNRPWTEKKVLYGALGALTPEVAKSILDDSGFTFNQTTEELAQISHYLPHLGGLAKRDADWDSAFVEERTESLLRLAYKRLKDWLGLEWDESETAMVTTTVVEDDDLDVDDAENDGGS